MHSSRTLLTSMVIVASLWASLAVDVYGQGSGSAADSSLASLPVPADYVIGPDDQLRVVFWKDPDLTTDVTVRSDGLISLPLLNDVKAAGLTPDQLREEVVKVSQKFITNPSVVVIVREIRSRRVFITGEINQPGAFPINGPMTVLQLLSLAGGTKEFADKTAIVILRGDKVLRFNYDEVKRGKNLQQNIALQVGDSVIVP